MLFKVFMMDNLAEQPDRIGVIETTTIQDAASRLIQWNAEEVDWADYVPSEPTIEILGPDEARVFYRVKDMVDDKEREGSEVYVIRPIGSDIFMFLAEDWKLVFD